MSKPPPINISKPNRNLSTTAAKLNLDDLSPANDKIKKSGKLFRQALQAKKNPASAKKQPMKEEAGRQINHEPAAQQKNQPMKEKAGQQANREPSAQQKNQPMKEKAGQQANREPSAQQKNQPMKGEASRQTNNQPAAQQKNQPKIQSPRTESLEKQSKQKQSKHKTSHVADNVAGSIAQGPDQQLQAQATTKTEAPAPLNQQQMVEVIQKASQRILLARGDGAQNMTVRIQLNNEMMPNTELTAQKNSDGALQLTFSTDNPQSLQSLQDLKAGLAQHLQQTQNIPVRIVLTNQEGENITQQEPQQQTDQQNQSQDQNKKPDWETVEDRLKSQ